MTMIRDAVGGRHGAGVNVRNQLLIDGEVNVSAHHVSLENGLAFNTVSIDANAVAADIVFYFKNTSTDKRFFVNLVRVQAANAGLWKIYEVTGTASGTAITPSNLNLISGSAAEATAVGDGAVTGLTEGKRLAVARQAAGTAIDVPFDDILILGTNDAFAVEYEAGTTGLAEVVMRGYFR